MAIVARAVEMVGMKPVMVRSITQAQIVMRVKAVIEVVRVMIVTMSSF